MHLGKLLQALRQETDAGLAFAALDDIALFAEVTAVGEAHGELPSEYVAAAASRFANLAGHEDWMQVVSAVERSDDAGKAVLEKVVRWALARDREAAMASGFESPCSCGG